MVLSTIYRQKRYGPNTPFARALGAEVRRLRRQRGMTQAQLGAPLTRSYVSAVERGRIVPSVPALAHMAARLGTDPGHLLPTSATSPHPSPRGRSARRHASAAPPALESEARDLVNQA
jgi:transcriptional regulator with XRE-family HTH domain